MLGLAEAADCCARIGDLSVALAGPCVELARNPQINPVRSRTGFRFAPESDLLP
ncbi:hypothetical protein ACVWY3_001499 [Bradyrhizobium sp. USDA 4486]